MFPTFCVLLVVAIDFSDRFQLVCGFLCFCIWLVFSVVTPNLDFEKSLVLWPLLKLILEHVNLHA